MLKIPKCSPKNYIIWITFPQKLACLQRKLIDNWLFHSSSLFKVKIFPNTVSANHFANFWALDKKPHSSKNKFFWLSKLISYERKLIFLSGKMSLIRIGIIRRRQTAFLSRHKKNHYSYIYAPIAFIFDTITDFGKLHIISKRRLKIPKILNFIW